MSQDSWIDVTGNALIQAIGTSKNPIIIRGERAASGFWNGIKITESKGINTFKQVRISDFGAIDISPPPELPSRCRNPD